MISKPIDCKFESHKEQLDAKICECAGLIMLEEER